MAPLVVYLVDSIFAIETIEKKSKEKNFHRCFVLENSEFKIYLNLKNTDSLFVFDYKKYKIECLLKMILIYVNPIYTHFLFVDDLNMNIEKNIDLLKKEYFFKNSEGFGFEKKYFIFNEISYEFKKDNMVDILEMSEIMDKAHKEIPLNNKEFTLAIDELLPRCKYEFDDEIKIEDDLKLIFEKKNIESKTRLLITDKMCDHQKNTICLSNSKIENCKFCIHRVDGLKLSYI